MSFDPQLLTTHVIFRELILSTHSNTSLRSVGSEGVSNSTSQLLCIVTDVIKAISKTTLPPYVNGNGALSELMNEAKPARTFAGVSLETPTYPIIQTSFISYTY